MKFKYLPALLSFVFFTCQCRHKPENTIITFPGKPEVPASIKREHEALLMNIHKMTLFEDSTGLAAKKLQELMQHHFTEEEDFVLPQLGILPLLADGKLPGASELIKLSDKLRSNYTHLTAEHQMIKAFMNELKLVATKENHPESIEFEKELHHHAQLEEEIYFPAALLAGEFLKLKSKESH